MSTIIEVNLDGLVGPTHNYSGLAFGNVAAESNKGSVSNPRLSALQGLSKMKLLHGLGIPQLVMPPPQRPHMPLLRSLGLRDAEDAAKRAPKLLPYAYSAASMWAANAATVAPSADTADGKVHITPANLMSTPHRSVEAPFTARVLKRIFPDTGRFVHHAPLPSNTLWADEGAANHTRLAREDGTGVHLFVYGRDGQYSPTRKFPARQSRQASEAIARLHGIDPANAFFLQQSPEAIDAGVFHNDVCAVGTGDVYLYHEKAYTQPIESGHFTLIKITEKELSLAEAVRTYLFNSQLVSIPGGGMLLIAPAECETSKPCQRVIRRLLGANDNPIQRVTYANVRESMRNGGGPACLRLRVPLTPGELLAVHPGVVFSDSLHTQLTAWVETHYRDRLAPADLADPALARETADALSALERLLDLKGLYDHH